MTRLGGRVGADGEGYRPSKSHTPSKATPTQVERAIAALRFGCVTLNGWSVLGYLAACKGASWGAHPDGGPRSGCGVSGNAYGHTHIIKTVVRPHTPRHRPSPPPPLTAAALTATAPRHLLPFHLLPPLSPGARPATHHRAALRRQRSTLRRLPESRAAAGARSLALPLAGPERGSCASFLRRLGARLAAPRRCRGRLIGCPATASAARASLPQSRRSHSFRPSRPRAPTGGLRRAARGPLRAVHGARAPPAMLAAGGARRAEPQRGSGRAGRTARGIRRSGLMFPPHPVPLTHS